MVILLDNYKLMNTFVRSIIENLFTQDYSDYLVDELYNEIYNLKENESEYERFKYLLFHNREDEISKDCIRIENILKRYNKKIREKFYYYSKSKIFKC